MLGSLRWLASGVQQYAASSLTGASANDQPEAKAV